MHGSALLSSVATKDSLQATMAKLFLKVNSIKSNLQFQL